MAGLRYRMDDYAQAWGEYCANGVFRSSPEDFVVTEELGFEPAGEGTHHWLLIEKRGVNTEWVVEKLSAFARVSPVDIGYAGLKDRHALTRQWFSINMLNRDQVAWDAIDDFTQGQVKVLSATRHPKKLKIGQLRGNRFAIRIRECHYDRACMEDRLKQIALGGVPNYFGEQRFGREGDNVEKALRFLSGKQRTQNRKQRGLYISSLRSFLFNHILGQRVVCKNWNTAIDGDVMMLDGSNSFFKPTSDENLSSRLAELDIHPSGLLYARGDRHVGGAAAQIESEVLAEFPEIATALDRVPKLNAERRSLRLAVRELEYELLENEVTLRFFLQKGCFATSVLRELVQLTDGHRASIDAGRQA
ncbi:MAG: tRNA pseudouridine(13) synthase TruD [Gammaproteobacteria bacterium]|nr:tRNA pseudouridine(13) synthase TruD [Gammaproteobacteria bacterium]